MDSSHTSSLRFRSRTGESIAAPPEWASCLIEICADPDSWTNLELSRNGEPLPLSLSKVAGEPHIVAEWPQSGAGSYTLELHHPDWSETRTCNVRPEKLSDQAFRTMLDDLQRRLPATIAIALQQAGALAGLPLIAPQETTLAEELNRITRACNGTSTRRGLIAVLRALAQQPHQVLQTIDVWTPRDRARRLTAATLYQAYAKPSNLDKHLNPLRVPEQRVDHTVDVYENRLLRGFFEQVNARLRRLCLAAASPRGSPAVAQTASTLLEQLVRARRECRFLDEVSDLAEPPTRLTMVLLKRSEYRAALEGFLEFRRSAVVQLDEHYSQRR